MFIGNEDSSKYLLTLAQQFRIQTFYTDGSFTKKNSAQTTTQMGFAWVESSNVNATTQDPIAFQGAIAFNPSSTKAEIYAFYRPFSSVLIPQQSIYIPIHKMSLIFFTRSPIS